MPYVVGLTGGIGSGKSAAADLFARLGAEVVDTDAIAHELTSAGGLAMARIRDRFGDDVIAPDGSLDRGRMRALAFSDPRARKALEEILHPLIRSIADERVQGSRAPYVVLVVPLLVESGAYREAADRIAVVDCDPCTQVERTMARSGLTRDTVERIIAAQATRQARLEIADDVIDNDGPLDALEPQVTALHACYLERARSIL
ncbi:MAG: dephospho-CoA kinase [Betaproteobacteria bacterium]|nr:dephospho-CoA kinase [Betaproteobacteria bacterium]